MKASPRLKTLRAGPASGAGNLRAGNAIEHVVGRILDVIRRGRRFLICSHARPDGDAVGSMLALAMLIEQMGKQADMISANRVPHIYRTLPGANLVRIAHNAEGQYDAAVLLECDGLERAEIAGLEAYQLINIDHHYTGSEYAQLNWVDQQAASVGEMVYRLALAAKAQITPEMATCLYTTLLTDTGGFLYGAVDASTFEMARELVAAGANPVKIAQAVSYSAPMSKVLLLGMALQNLKREGRVSWLWVTHQDMVRACASDEDSDGIVNYALGIAGIEAAVFMRELADGRVRVSLRSKGGLNVAGIAAGLGGGGHRNAAGCALDWTLPRAIEELPRLLHAGLAEAAVCAEEPVMPAAVVRIF